jgi:hypothetical protein
MMLKTDLGFASYNGGGRDTAYTRDGFKSVTTAFSHRQSSNLDQPLGKLEGDKGIYSGASEVMGKRAALQQSRPASIFSLKSDYIKTQHFNSKQNSPRRGPGAPLAVVLPSSDFEYFPLTVTER